MNGTASFSRQNLLDRNTVIDRKGRSLADGNDHNYPFVSCGFGLGQAIPQRSWQSMMGGILDHDARISQMRQVATAQLAQVEELLGLSSPLYYQLKGSFRSLANHLDCCQEERSEGTEHTAQDDFGRLIAEPQQHRSNLSLYGEGPLRDTPYDMPFFQERQERHFTEFPRERYIDIEDFFNQ